MSAERKIFGRLQNTVEPPDLIEIQTKSYDEFLQADVAPTKRAVQGLQQVFKEIFPVKSWEGHYELDFLQYRLGEPKFDYFAALSEGQTYSRPLYATFRLKDGTDIRDEDVFLGDMPVMTTDGAFVINGAERVIVSQLHRSPGISTERTEHANGQKLLSVRIIPDRGSWIEIMFDTNDVMWCFMDQRRRRRKFFATTLLRALGYGQDEEILRCFYDFKTLKTNKPYSDKDLHMLVMKNDEVDTNSNAVIARRYDPCTPAMMDQIAAAGLTSVEVVDVSFDNGILIKTLREDAKAGIHNEEDALKDIYKRMRPGDPPTSANAKQMMQRLFFELAHYDLGRVGRYKLNKRLAMPNVPDDLRTLQNSGMDVIEAIRLLLDIAMGRAEIDDIDHLGNRRIRTTGELLQNQCRIGLARMERLVRERMTVHDSASSGALTPSKLVNAKTFSSVVGDFFSRSQLSQFMDQTNPLSGLAHKRRLSALGPGGLSRERAGFEVRDVHPSHYGRICPIETPEGPNIGLISSLGLYARVNSLGFIETPYRLVKNGKVTDAVHYLAADAEEQFVIAQANAPLNKDRSFAEAKVTCRYRQEFCDLPRERVQYMDVAPVQVISIAAGLIPFLEHDDANRALMGANMMRQGVPLLRTERPYVGTGLEAIAAKDSRVTVIATNPGIVAYVSSMLIVVTDDGKLPKNFDLTKLQEVRTPTLQAYTLQKFRRCNAGTCFNQRPIVRRGDTVKPGDCLADGPATDSGELALGKNLLVAFMSWRGYNFEDAILVNERLVKEDALTSLHIVTFECNAKETKLGWEEITRDIPNVSDDALRNLGPDGIIRRGAEVKPGDILVGKVTPKGETELSPEEKLLRAIFGEKAADVRDTSLKVPPGTTGIVMDVKVETQQDTERASAGDEDSKTAAKLKRDAEKRRTEQLKKLEAELVAALCEAMGSMKVHEDVRNEETGDIIIPANKRITKKALDLLAKAHDRFTTKDENALEKINSVMDSFRERFVAIEDAAQAAFDEANEYEANPEHDGIVKKVRVYLVDKKNLSVGDKMAGRHGNKGCISRILPSCDMPFLPDGTPVDIVLNPLGVPSRMNLGQLFETYLGLACRLLNFHAATPCFDGVQEYEIDEYLKKAREVQEKEEGESAWINTDGKTILYDGMTGEPFAQRVVVGVIYMLKLHHLVTDKIHARSTGSYSLVTQQPLGGKAQLGGQRMGEMEVWALEAYGVAYALQELLTVKSDDVQGRTRIYESIVKGTNVLDSGMPESFSVLIHELRGLCLDMELLGGEKKNSKKQDKDAKNELVGGNDL